MTTPPTERQPELLGQTVVVMGGSAGIGLETARKARAEGADIILTGRSPERLQHAASELGALSTASFDATDSEALEGFFKSIEVGAVLREIRPDWDLSAPGLRDAWNSGNLSPFHGWNKCAPRAPSAG